MKISVIIPSLNPDDKLVSVVDSLVKKGFEDIIIVKMCIRDRDIIHLLWIQRNHNI